MAVRNLTDYDTVKMNIIMKDGREFLGCDLVSRPTGEFDKIVAFWYDNAVRMVPLQDVRHVDFYNSEY